jgi:hypothetical protein
MSEYQYYEFQALDRPLTQEQMSELRAYSSRARITPSSFVNVYNWGDFKGNPLRWVEQYFDAFLYFANWGSRRFMLRLPKKLRWRGSERRSLWEKSSGRWCHEGSRGRGVMSPRRRAETKGKRRQAGFGASIKSHGTAQRNS